MAIIDATPSTLSARVSSASAGDVVRLGAGTYSGLTTKSNVILRAVDHEEGRVLKGTTGHLGNGMAVRVTGPLNISTSNVRLEGIFHDTRGYSGINAGVITGDNVHFYDCSAAARPSSGARQIGYTVGSGSDRNTGFRYVRGRHHPTGQRGQKLDHAFYIKNATDWAIIQTLIYDGGRFPIHLYTNGDNGVVDQCVIWDSEGCITFSGASDSSTGTSTYGTSDNNTLKGSILGKARTGSLVETWVSDSSRPVSGNVVKDNLFWTAGAGASYPPASLRGVSFSGNVQKDPGFKNASAGDFTRTGTYDGYGPPQLFGAVTPPPPPPPPPPDPDDEVIEELRAKLALAEKQLGEQQRELDDATAQLALAQAYQETIRVRDAELVKDFEACRNRAESIQANYKSQRLKDALVDIVNRAQMGIDRIV